MGIRELADVLGHSLEDLGEKPSESLRSATEEAEWKTQRGAHTSKRKSPEQGELRPGAAEGLTARIRRVRSEIVKGSPENVEMSGEESIPDSAHAVCDRTPERPFEPIDLAEGEENRVVPLPYTFGPQYRRSRRDHMRWDQAHNENFREMQEGFELAATQHGTSISANQLIRYRRWYGPSIAGSIRDDDPERQRKIHFAFEHIPQPVDVSDDSLEIKAADDPSRRWPKEISSLEYSSLSSPMPEDVTERAKQHRQRKDARHMRNQEKCEKADRLDRSKAKRSKIKAENKARRKKRDQQLNPEKYEGKKSYKRKRKAEIRSLCGLDIGQKSQDVGKDGGQEELNPPKRWTQQAAWADASSDDESYYSRPARFGETPKEKKPKKKGAKIVQEGSKIVQTHFVEPADSAGYDEVEFCGTGGKSPPPPSKEVAETRQAVQAQEQQLTKAQETADAQARMIAAVGAEQAAQFFKFMQAQSGQETPSGSGSVAEHTGQPKQASAGSRGTKPVQQKKNQPYRVQEARRPMQGYYARPPAVQDESGWWDTLGAFHDPWRGVYWKGYYFPAGGKAPYRAEMPLDAVRKIPQSLRALFEANQEALKFFVPDPSQAATEWKAVSQTGRRVAAAPMVKTTVQVPQMQQQQPIRGPQQYGGPPGAQIGQAPFTEGVSFQQETPMQPSWLIGEAKSQFMQQQQQKLSRMANPIQLQSQRRTTRAAQQAQLFSQNPLTPAQHGPPRFRQPPQPGCSHPWDSHHGATRGAATHGTAHGATRGAATNAATATATVCGAATSAAPAGASDAAAAGVSGTTDAPTATPTAAAASVAGDNPDWVCSSSTV